MAPQATGPRCVLKTRLEGQVPLSQNWCPHYRAQATAWYCRGRAQDISRIHRAGMLTKPPNLLEVSQNVLRIIFLSSFFVRSFGKFCAAQQSSPNFVPASKALDPSLSAAPSLVLWHPATKLELWGSLGTSRCHAGHGIIPSSNLPSPFTRFLA